jgi:hypothetical protein
MNTFQVNQVVASLCQVHVQILKKKMDNANLIFTSNNCYFTTS